MYLIHQAFFVFRFRHYTKLISQLKKIYYSLCGVDIGKGTIFSRIHISWPHQVKIGKNCLLEDNISFKYDGVWEKGPSILIGNNVFIGTSCEFNIKKFISVGSDTLIASGCRFVDHDYGINLDQLIRTQQGPGAPIKIGTNVWLGCNVIILKGIEIGDGAVVAAGAVVTKSILENKIWAGVPARKIGDRK